MNATQGWLPPGQTPRPMQPTVQPFHPLNTQQPLAQPLAQPLTAQPLGAPTPMPPIANPLEQGQGNPGHNMVASALMSQLPQFLQRLDNGRDAYHASIQDWKAQNPHMLGLRGEARHDAMGPWREARPVWPGQG